jgi:outer membrane protein assembly factor BamE (lipoprotein component of BamABCDE complex)
LQGCTTTGSTGNTVLGDADKANVYKMICDNITTKSDARKLLGDPTDIDFYENSGQEKWIYTHVDKSSLWRNYLPILNFFSRGTKDIQKKVILIFDKDGILKKSLVSENVGETKHGLLD